MTSFKFPTTTRLREPLLCKLQHRIRARQQSTMLSFRASATASVCAAPSSANAAARSVFCRNPMRFHLLTMPTVELSTRSPCTCSVNSQRLTILQHCLAHLVQRWSSIKTEIRKEASFRRSGSTPCLVSITLSTAPSKSRKVKTWCCLAEEYRLLLKCAKAAVKKVIKSISLSTARQTRTPTAVVI